MTATVTEEIQMGEFGPTLSANEECVLPDVAYLVRAGDLDDPAFRRAEVRAAEAGITGFLP